MVLSDWGFGEWMMTYGLHHHTPPDSIKPPSVNLPVSSSEKEKQEFIAENSKYISDDSLSLDELRQQVADNQKLISNKYDSLSTDEAKDRFNQAVENATSWEEIETAINEIEDSVEPPSPTPEGLRQAYISENQKWISDDSLSLDELKSQVSANQETVSAKKDSYVNESTKLALDDAVSKATSWQEILNAMNTIEDVPPQPTEEELKQEFVSSNSKWISDDSNSMTLSELESQVNLNRQIVEEKKNSYTTQEAKDALDEAVANATSWQDIQNAIDTIQDEDVEAKQEFLQENNKFISDPSLPLATLQSQVQEKKETCNNISNSMECEQEKSAFESSIENATSITEVEEAIQSANQLLAQRNEFLSANGKFVSNRNVPFATLQSEAETNQATLQTALDECTDQEAKSQLQSIVANATNWSEIQDGINSLPPPPETVIKADIPIKAAFLTSYGEDLTSDLPDEFTATLIDSEGEELQTLTLNKEDGYAGTFNNVPLDNSCSIQTSIDETYENNFITLSDGGADFHLFPNTINNRLVLSINKVSKIPLFPDEFMKYDQGDGNFLIPYVNNNDASYDTREQQLAWCMDAARKRAWLFFHAVGLSSSSTPCIRMIAYIPSGKLKYNTASPYLLGVSGQSSPYYSSFQLQWNSTMQWWGLGNITRSTDSAKPYDYFIRGYSDVYKDSTWYPFAVWFEEPGMYNRIPSNPNNAWANKSIAFLGGIKSISFIPREEHPLFKTEEVIDD